MCVYVCQYLYIVMICILTSCFFPSFIIGSGVSTLYCFYGGSCTACQNSPSGTCCGNKCTGFTCGCSGFYLSARCYNSRDLITCTLSEYNQASGNCWKAASTSYFCVSGPNQPTCSVAAVCPGGWTNTGSSCTTPASSSTACVSGTPDAGLCYTYASAYSYKCNDGTLPSGGKCSTGGTFSLSISIFFFFRCFCFEKPWPLKLNIRSGFGIRVRGFGSGLGLRLGLGLDQS